MKIKSLLSALVFVCLNTHASPLSQKVNQALRKNDLVSLENFLRKEVDNNNPEAKAFLASLILKRKTPSTKNLSYSEENTSLLRLQAMPLLEESALANNPLAQYMLARQIKLNNPNREQRKKFNKLISSAAQQNFTPAILHNLYHRPLVKYGKKDNKYLLIDLSQYPLNANRKEKIDCVINDYSLSISESYLDKLKSDLQGKNKEHIKLITDAAQCLLHDINTVTYRLNSRDEISDIEGKLFHDYLIVLIGSRAFGSKVKIYNNPDVLLALGDMIDATNNPHWSNVDFKNLNPNIYETVDLAKRSEFYYKAIVAANNNPQFSLAVEKAREKLQKLANLGSPSAKKKIALLVKDDKKIPQEDKVTKLRSMAMKGNISAMRQLGELHVQKSEMGDAAKWLQLAAYSNDNKAMALLSDLWEKSENPDEKVLGAFWGQLVVQLGSDDKHNSFYVSDDSIEVQEMYTFLFSLKPDARGETIPDKFLYKGLALHSARLAKRQEQESKSGPENINTDDEELQSLSHKALKGDEAAMTELAKRYYEGLGLNKNKAKAFSLLQKSREHKNESYKILKLLKEYDNDIKALIKNQNKKLAELDKNAKSGKIAAINHLIKAYSTGIGAPYAPKKAREYQRILEKMESKLLQ